ncbi:hypothetical protein BJ741DRAFT_635222 [Chytriomyces cf. hyalinus JEL632]|nr:hypothetical protein BJ741DRAFT_635222 [Chytriomyces cf. hyalinus JEL632]
MNSFTDERRRKAPSSRWIFSLMLLISSNASMTTTTEVFLGQAFIGSSINSCSNSLMLGMAVLFSFTS